MNKFGMLFLSTLAAVAAVGGFQVCPGETLSTLRRASSQRLEPRKAPPLLVSQIVGPSPTPEPLFPSISKQVLSSFDGRDLRNDIVLGITEGVIFEACKGESLCLRPHSSHTLHFEMMFSLGAPLAKTESFRCRCKNSIFSPLLKLTIPHPSLPLFVQSLWT